MKVFDKTWKLAVAGALVGVLAALLAYFGNPANMAICIACFVRDTAETSLSSTGSVFPSGDCRICSGSICNLTGDERV